MEILSVPGQDPLGIESKALEDRLRWLKETANQPDAKGLAESRLRKVSQDLESIFVKMLLDTMQKSVPESELTGSSSGMDTWKGMFNEKLAQQLSHQQSLGLAEMIYKQLSADLNRHRDVPPAGESPAGTENAVPGSDEAPAVPGSGKTGAPGNGEQSELPGTVARFKAMIEHASGKYGLDPALISAVIMQESGGDPQAVSPAGARGLMQLMPKTAESLGVENPFDPAQNIRAGTRYLKKLLEYFGGDETLALAAYNAGPSAVERHGGVPPYPETRDYIHKVKAFRNIFSSSAAKTKSI